MNCPKCNKTESVIKGKPEYGGGWVCWKNKGGCGHTWKEASAAAPPPPVESPKQGNGWRQRDPSETNSIIRQSSLKSAVEFSAGKNGSVKEVLAVAETFAAWVQGNVRVGTATPDKATLAKSLAEMVEETLEEADNAPHPAEARR